MIELADFHIHPDYSKDASGSIDEYCQQAINIGLGSICFTTHYDKDPKRIEIDAIMIHDGMSLPLSDDSVALYLNEIDEAKIKYSGSGLKVYRGLEIDFFQGVEPEAKRIKEKFEFDFILGSVHCLENLSISSHKESGDYWNNRSAEQMFDEYFAMLDQAADCKYFDALGHLDYHIRFAPKYYGDAAFEIDIENYDPIFEKLKKNNIGIEVNTKPFQNGQHDFHPSKNIIKRAVEFGVKISSVGSDCHQPGLIGTGIKEAYEFLDQYGIKPEFPK